jgi:hypothetical protein
MDVCMAVCEMYTPGGGRDVAVFMPGGGCLCPEGLEGCVAVFIPGGPEGVCGSVHTWPPLPSRYEYSHMCPSRYGDPLQV